MMRNAARRYATLASPPGHKAAAVEAFAFRSGHSHLRLLRHHGKHERKIPMPIPSILAKIATAAGLGLLLGACAGPHYGPTPHRAPVAHAPPPQAHCPPGLAKKGQCVPPGHQKRWQRGDVLPEYVRYRVLSRYRDYGFRHPPRGHVYIEVDGGIYLMAQSSRRIAQVFVSSR